MNDDTINLDQAEEDILSCTASDDAIEAAAGTETVTVPTVTMEHRTKCPGCPSPFGIESPKRITPHDR